MWKEKKLAKTTKGIPNIPAKTDRNLFDEM